MKNVVFDLGRVLIDWNPKSYLEKNIKDKKKITDLAKNVFQSNEWFMLDRGTISEEDAVKIFKKRCPQCEKEIDMLIKDILELLPPINKNVDILREVSKKYDTYILSNFHERTFSLISEKYDWISCFKGEVVSARVKLLKPEEAIYYVLLDKYNLNPAETVFIDDTKENIEAAEKIGIKGIHYTGEQDLNEMLKEFINI